MISIKNLFRNGPGPSSSYSLHPYRIASDFKDEHHEATTIKVTFYGLLAENCDENFTKQALKGAISPLVSRFFIDNVYPMPPNTIAAKFEAYGKEKNLIEEKIYYFNKLGESSELAEYNNKNVSSHDLLEWTYSNGRSVWEYAIKTDSSNLEEFIKTKWEIMKKSIKDGLHIEGGLPDSNINTRRASLFLSRAMQNRDFIQPISKTMAYAMAIAEENVSAKEVVAAPTAKSAGVIPSVLTILMETYKVSETRIIRGLITAGFIGKLLFKQIIDGDTHSDIIIASAMASGAAVQILGGTPRQVIAAAAISLNSLKANHEIQENSHLDYVELNGIAAANAINNATLALLSDNSLSKEIDFFDELTQWNRQAINC